MIFFLRLGRMHKNEFIFFNLAFLQYFSMKPGILIPDLHRSKSFKNKLGQTRPNHFWSRTALSGPMHKEKVLHCSLAEQWRWRGMGEWSRRIRWWEMANLAVALTVLELTVALWCCCGGGWESWWQLLWSIYFSVQRHQSLCLLSSSSVCSSWFFFLSLVCLSFWSLFFSSAFYCLLFFFFLSSSLFFLCSLLFFLPFRFSFVSVFFAILFFSLMLLSKKVCY